MDPDYDGVGKQNPIGNSCSVENLGGNSRARVDVEPATNEAALTPPIPDDLIRMAVTRLSDGQLLYLTSSTSITSTTKPPPIATQPIPQAPSYTAFDFQPTTRLEHALLVALQEGHAREAALRRQVAEVQAAHVLNVLYCQKLRVQLAHQEKKKAKGKGSGRLLGDGLPCFLSGD